MTKNLFNVTPIYCKTNIFEHKSSLYDAMSICVIHRVTIQKKDPDPFHSNHFRYRKFQFPALNENGKTVSMLNCKC